MESASLQESFLILRDCFVGYNRSSDAASPAHLVLFAENAAKERCYSIAVQCLDLYFSLDPPINQFLIRAHLCRALTTATADTAAEPEERLQRAVESVVTAVEIARKSECYHFLVHNAAVVLWQICRPHRWPGWMGLCVSGWQSVAKAQEVCKEEDHNWRLDILLELLQSQVDAGLREEAGKTCLSALQLARKRVPERLPSVLKLCVFHGLGEGKGVEKEVKSVSEYPIISRLYKLKHTLTQSSARQTGEVEVELRELVEATTTNKTQTRKTPAPSKSTPQPPHTALKATILLEIAQVCVGQGLVELCGECVAALPTEEEGIGSGLELLRHTVTTQLTLLQQTAGYSRAAVEIRERVIAQLENCLTAAQRQGDQELVQHVGVIVWGVCLPLLQPNLRSRLSHTLSSLASALEQADSLLHGLRCVVHMELAKVCADEDKLKTALEHIEKAQVLDRECEWSDQLRWLGERLQLRSELYLTPPSPLLQATQLLEQVRSSSGCGTKGELRAILVKVGGLLAPNHFQVAIGDRPVDPPEQHSQSEVNSAGEREGVPGEGCEGVPGEGVSGDDGDDGDDGNSEATSVMRGEEVEGEGEGEGERDKTKDRERLYEVLKQQVQAHKEEMGETNGTDRCRLWADLAKFARKCEVWDVAFVAAKFCLIFDDNRWTVAPVKTTVQPSKTGSKLKVQKSSSVSVNRSRSDASTRSSSLSVPALAAAPAAEREAGRRRGREKLCRDLLRTLAETHFIHGECAVYQLKEGGHELGDGLPPSPLKHQSGSEESNENLVVWPGQLSSDAYSSFLRAGELGCSLSEGWLVANSATFLCNYSHHLLEGGPLSPLVPVFRALLASVVAVREQGTSEETIGAELVCRLSTVLAGGLVQKWTPSPPDPTTPDPSKETQGGKKSGRGAAAGKKKGGGGGGENQLQVSPDAGPELQEALGVCERGLAGARELSLSVRAPLLAVWVHCKQLLQQPIPSKTLGVEEKDGECSAGQCRAVVAVEMLSLLGNKIWDFPDCPTLPDAFELVSLCVWSAEDLLLELELLTRIARLALLQNNHSLVSSCTQRALLKRDRPEEKGKKKKKKKKSDTQREKELLSSISSLQGQALVSSGGGKKTTARTAMGAFLQSAKYGRDAGSYQCVVEASRHYWKVCRELVGSALDREAVRQPLTELLTILTSFLPRRSSQHSVGQSVSEEDLQLHLAIYNVLFQIYIDKGEWEEGLNAVKEAMWVTPRTIHQDLAEYKLLFRGRMGQDVAPDMVRFQEAPEEERARLWYMVACNSSSPQLQLTALQNSIDMLTDGVWVKVDRILSLSEWLYTHQFPTEDSLGHLKWALTLLLDTGGEREREEEGEDGEEEEQAEPECGVGVREKAVQILVMMARLQGRGSGGHRESCLTALAHCYLLWKETFDSYSQSVSGKSSIHLPTSVQEWVDFTPTDELKDFVKSDESNTSVNPHSIRTPGLTCHYLGALSDELCASGLHGLALPVETLRLLLFDCLLQSVAATQLTHLRLGWMCGVLGAQSASDAHQSLAGPVFLNPEDIARSRVEKCQFQQKQEMLERGGSKSSCSTPSPPLSTDTPVLRQVWVEEAALLVKQGQCDTVRQLLQEAQLSSQVFGDEEAMGRVLLVKATLAASEKRVGECIDNICEAQKYPLSLDQWEEGLQLLLKLAESQRSLREAVVETVSDAVSSHSSAILGGNSNESERVEPVVATLQARILALKAGMILDDSEGNTDKLEELCLEMAANTERLTQLGRHEEAVRTMLDHTRIIRRGIAGSLNSASNRVKLLKGVELAKRAVDTLQLVLKDTLSLCSLPEELCAPCEGLLVEAGLELAAALLQVSEKYVQERREERNKQLQKTCVEQMIGDYVRVNPKHGSPEDIWNKVASIAAERALAAFDSTASSGVVKSHTRLKVKCLYGMGRALVLMSEQANPDPTPHQWRQGKPGDSGGMTHPLDGGGRGGVGVLESQQSNLSQSLKEVSNTETTESESVQYLKRGSQSLREALSLALQCGEMEVAAEAALKIVDSWGTHDARTTALHLAVYQSCVVSQHLLQLLHRVQSDPTQSRLAALLHQHSELTHTTPLSLPPPLLGAVTEQLNTYMCWQRLGVSGDYMDLLRYFPHTFRFLILQHSEDKSQLYTAYLVPPQPPPPAAKKGQPPPITVSELPVVSCVGVSSRDRERLLETVDSCHKLQAQQLLKDTPALECAMSQQFRSIAAAMDDYLSTALEPISLALQKEKSDEGLTMVLLADFELLQLPLEALQMLQSDHVKAVARDFSLQMHYHRIKKYLVEDEDTSSRKKEKFQLQPPFLQANTTNFRYILDPRCDLSSTDADTDVQPPNKIVSQINAFPKITSKWSGHRGIATEDAMSCSQWYPLLEQCSGLLFLASERLLAHFPPSQLTPLSLQECSIAIIMDHMQTMRSSLTQSKLDLHKRREVLQAEKSVEMAALMSLAGVNCLISRQWHSSVNNCTDTLCTLLKGLLSEGVCVAELRWREVREPRNGTEAGEQPTEPSTEQKDHSSVFNSTVYGLPHLALNPLTQ